MVTVNDDVVEAGSLQHQEKLVPEVEADVEPVDLLGDDDAVSPHRRAHLEYRALLERIERDDA